MLRTARRDHEAVGGECDGGAERLACLLTLHRRPTLHPRAAVELVYTKQAGSSMLKVVGQKVDRLIALPGEDVARQLSTY